MEHTNLTRRVASGLTAALLATGALTGVAVAAAPPAQASAPAASDQAARFEVNWLAALERARAAAAGKDVLVGDVDYDSAAQVAGAADAPRAVV